MRILICAVGWRLIVGYTIDPGVLAIMMSSARIRETRIRVMVV